ncbi:HrpT family type III secretion system protein [Brenneria rubrifaciens]|uniref:Type III secretion protein HrpT n=1 Tax=Brenneria rubrifaciens TaxID=55213 RepID=A0A4P8QSV4_9GAMM|nr:HrpT family type III secretion system protein [Brenneria rubrifaciens]QCR08549.1 type III secretion protein HrpT [Brenneria rubrifaciens]
MWAKYLLPVAAVLLLNACSSSRSVANCTSVKCRPQPEGRQLVIWWQPDLRLGNADFSKVNVDD